MFLIVRLSRENSISQIVHNPLGSASMQYIEYLMNKKLICEKGWWAFSIQSHLAECAATVIRLVVYCLLGNKCCTRTIKQWLKKAEHAYWLQEAWRFWKYLIYKRHFLENIWRRNVDQKPNNNSPSSILWTFALLKRYFQKYEISRRYLLETLLSVNGFKKKLNRYKVRFLNINPQSSFRSYHTFYTY